MMRDFGIDWRIRVNTDASAGKGIACRRGLGKVRHIEVNQLWIQDRVANGDIEILGEFGFDENRVGERTNSSTWRSWSGNEEPFVLTTDTQRWDTKSTICMIPMHIHSMVAGFISLYFSTPCDKSARINILKEAERYAEILALYLSLTYAQFSMSAHDIFNRGSTPSSLTENIELTERQLKILRGIASGKTNHSLAHELGYSVSTIRHETMRIFNLLNVSDRKASAQAALALGLI
jgi:DNA-binding CsgD family transcriptional regulator